MLTGDHRSVLRSGCGPNQIQLSAAGRGIVDYFLCFTCDQHVWDCDHLIDERLLSSPRTPALAGSQLESFAYDGKSRALEIEFRVTTPHGYSEIPSPPPPCVIQYFEVPRYVVTKLLAFKTARGRNAIGKTPSGNI
jgi:hypothetical protein